MLPLFSELIGPMVIAFVLGSFLAVVVAFLVLPSAPTTDDDSAPARRKGPR